MNTTARPAREIPLSAARLAIVALIFIRSAMPDAEEVISYGVPMFRRNGKSVIAMSAKKDYCGLYLMSPLLAKAMENKLKKYLKGVTLHFTPDKPLPISLVKRSSKCS